MLNINDLIGTKFYIHGRNKKEGFDCYGLVIEIAKRCGHYLPDLWYMDTSSETFSSSADTILKELRNAVQKVYDPEEGDMVIFLEGLKMVHIGVMVDDERFIHCDKSGVHISVLNAYFRRNYAIYRWV